jgi:hypothetical protein
MDREEESTRDVESKYSFIRAADYRQTPTQTTRM